MPFPIEALEAVKKIVMLEQRVSELTEAMKELTRSAKDLDRRLSKVEAKLDVYDGLIARRPSRRSTKSRRSR